MSEFGTGFSYNLGLFLCHDERRDRYKKAGMMSASSWFNGAADHLFDIKIPENFSDKELAEKFVSSSLSWKANDHAQWEDTDWAIQTAKDLLRAWDVQCGIESERGNWE